MRASRLKIVILILVFSCNKQSAIDSSFLSATSTCETLNETDSSSINLQDFGGGTSTNVTWNSLGFLQLSTGQTSGTYFSRVMLKNNFQNNEWRAFGWTPRRPFGMEAPGLGTLEPTYNLGNFPASNVAAIYHLNETSLSGSVNEVIDSSGNGNHGYMDGTVPNVTVSNGKLGNALLYSGGKFIRIPDSSSLHGGSSLQITKFSYAFWAYFDDLSTDFGILSKRISFGNQESFSCWQNSATNTLWIDYTVAGTRYRQNSNVAVTTGAWIHVAVTYDGTSGSGPNYPVKIYANGSLATTLTIPSPYFDGTTADLYLGNLPNGGSVLQGKLDEVIILNEVFSASDVESLYLRGAANLKFQIRTCQKSDCSDGAWGGYDGTASTYFTNANFSGSSFPHFSIGPYSSTFFQYKVMFSSDSATIGPELMSVYSTALFCP